MMKGLSITVRMATIGLVACVCVAGFAGAASASTINLLTNGDFEAGDTGFTTGLTADSGLSADGTYTITTDPSATNGYFRSIGDHTTGSGNMLAINGSTTEDTVIWSETVDVVAGEDYDFTAWIARIWGSYRNDTYLVINGVTLDTIGTPYSGLQAWYAYSLTWNSGSATSAVIQLTQKSTNEYSKSIALDDLSFVGEAPGAPSEVPLPAAIWLFGSAAAGGRFASRGKKRRQ